MMGNECAILAGSNPGEEVDSGDNAAREYAGGSDWPASTSLFDKD